MQGHTVLVIDDETFLRKSIAGFLQTAGVQTSTARNLAEARTLCARNSFDFVLLDVHLPDGNGLEFLQEGVLPKTSAVVIMTAEGGVQTAVQAIRNGAADYLSKPFDLDALPLLFERIASAQSSQRLREFSAEQSGPAADSYFIGKRLRSVRQQMDKILLADRRLQNRLPPVLIEGETGSGKSTLARWLHQEGPRTNSPLVEVNASTLPESLAEAELFGHERGAFTDARRERIGLFEAAHGGTLFIDEISALPLALQAKLLTVIEDGKIRRLGSNQPRSVDVRLMVASLHPLQQLVTEGAFREDLYHRLNLLYLNMPPLRDFPEDLPPLAEFILQRLKKRYRMPTAKLTDSGRQRLLEYRWPGNVRELEHEIERGLVFSDSGQIDLGHLPCGSKESTAAATDNPLLNPAWRLPDATAAYDFEADLKALTLAVIQRAMAEQQGNVSAAARQLGVPRDFIRYRIQSDD